MVDEKEGQGIEMQMEAPVKRPNTALWVILTIAISGIVFGACGYWLGTQKAEEPVATATATSTVAASGTTTADVTANWKTYMNESYGVTFKYPNGWTVTEETLQAAGVTGGVHDKLVVSGPSNKSLTLWVNQDGFGLEGASYAYRANVVDGKINISSKEKNTSTEFDQTTERAQAVIGVLTASSTNGYTLSYDYPRSDEVNSLKEFDQILSTFQFTP